MCEAKYIEIFEKEDGVKAFFTTKEGAVDGMPGGTIFDNRELFREAGLEETFKIWPKQVHGVAIEAIRKEDLEGIKEYAERSGLHDGVAVPETDGVMTNAKGVLLTSVHADCLPVYLYDGKKEAIGLVHAGWRGAAAGIVPQAVRKMACAFGAAPDDIKVCIGPGIGKCCFEVGEEVASRFLLEWGASFAEPIDRREDEPIDGAGASPETKYLLDLKAAVKYQALGAGIREEHISISEHCTCCEPETFCSFRRDGETYRRMGAGICMV